MSVVYDDLIDKITASGVSKADAQIAVRHCEMAMIKGGLVGYTAGGALAYFLAMNPASAFPFLIGTTATGAGYQLLKSPACSEVREAVSFWKNL